MNTVSPTQIQALCQQAIGFHQRGQMAEAEQTCLQILAADAGNALACNVLALVRSDQGRHDEALTLLNVILKANPRATAALSNRGLVLQAAGRFLAALASYDEFLKLVPNHPVVLVNRGNSLASLGRSDEALATYQRALQADPNNIGGHANRGFLLLKLGRSAEALAVFDHLLTLRPNFPVALVNRGHALLQLGRNEEAIKAYDAALAVSPREADVWNNRGTAFAALGRDEEALASYDQAIAINPAFAGALVNRGNATRKLGRLADARANYDRALAANPREATAHYGRAMMFAEERRFAEAANAYDEALRIKPDYAEAAYNRGLALAELRRFADAATSYDLALKRRPGWADAWNNRGIAQMGLGRFDPAIADFARAVAADPNYAEGWFNHSYAVWEYKRDQVRAVADLDRVLAINPDFEFARGDRLHLKMQIADWNGFAAEVGAIEAAVRAGRRVIRPFAIQAISDSVADLYASALQFAERFQGAPAVARRSPQDSGKIRVGYVSSDFREQATAYLTAGLYECHDKEKFEIFAVDSGESDRGPTRTRLEAAFDHFMPITHLSDEEAAQKIADAGIDILVNLNGYFGKPRTGVFARRAAPVQVNYLGFPGTLGADFIDYIVADRVVIPEAEERFYREKVVTLPDSYQVNDSKRAIGAAPSRAQVGLPEAAFVFCNFNQTYKLVPRTFDLWMEILKQAEGSVLWLLEIHQSCIANLRKEAEARGVAGERLIFAPFVPVADHLARLQCADLFLDSLPYTAHTTASDALWAGVPLLTCMGTTFPGRVAASLLRAAGLPELVTSSAQDYTALALRLAREPQLLQSFRDRLAGNRTQCALFDTARFTRNLEQAYATMVARARRGEPPACFGVSA